MVQSHDTRPHSALSSDQVSGIEAGENTSITSNMSLQPLLGNLSIGPSYPSPSASSSSNLPDGASQNVSHGETSAPKRNACNTCRKRKLRCDGGTPACGRCMRLHHDCEYSERRRKSGPRRGYVKVLETRLAQVEGLLKEKETPGKINEPLEDPHHQRTAENDRFTDADFAAIFGPPQGPEMNQTKQKNPFASEFYTPVGAGLPDPPIMNEFSWTMIGLGVDEPLPSQDITDELTQIYFSKVHPTAPMIHQYRILAAMNFSSRVQPSISLRYAMWTMAASVSDKYKDLQSLFYSRARKYVEADERSARQVYLNIRHAQALLLLAIYESKNMLFPTSWLTISRATRFTQMLGLHRLDGVGTESKQSLPAAVDWSEKEERRRTFWFAFSMDRYASVGTGWPVVIDERDITTNLPSSEEEFAQTTAVPGISLRDAMEHPLTASKISSFAGNVITASLSGSILAHIHRPSPGDDDSNLNGHFWKSHRRIDNILLNTSLCLPSHLRLPAGLSNANTIFLNMSLHAGTICLHQDAIFKAEKLELSPAIIAESKSRCLTAATEICSIMKTIAHIDLSFLNVYTPFVIYLGTRVFAQIWKTNPEDDNAKSSVRFLLSALVALKEYIPLSELYLIQLDLEGSGLTAMDGKVPTYSSVEMQMAGMSLGDATDDISWITYVSPLVRPGETSSNKPSPSSGTSGKGKSPASIREYTEPTPPVPEGSFAGLQPEQTPNASSMGGFAANENWDFGEVNLPPEMFDPVAGIDMTFWSNQH